MAHPTSTVTAGTGLIITQWLAGVSLLFSGQIAEVKELSELHLGKGDPARLE